MRNAETASERDLVWEWVSAEIESGRFGQLYQSLPRRVRELIRVDERTKLTDAEWGVLTQKLYWARGPLLNGLREVGTQWYTVVLENVELPSLKIMNWPPLVVLSPNRTLAGLVTALEQGRNPPGDQMFGENFRRLRREYEAGRMRGRPILVAEELRGPYTVVEGYSRLSVLAAKYAEKSLGEATVNVLVGVSTRIKDWHLYDVYGNKTDHRLY